MRERTAGPNEDGQRLDRVLKKWLPNAEQGFLFKMLRKKTITVNDRKASGADRLKEGDVIRAWFSEETFQHFAGEAFSPDKEQLPGKTEAAGRSPAGRKAVTGRTPAGRKDIPEEPLRILYEDASVIAALKPPGVLSQKAEPGDWSINEQILSYLLEKGEITKDSLRTFKPGVVNRLDRNTGGIILFGKTLSSLRLLTDLIRERRIGKYYLAGASGEIREAVSLTGELVKQEGKNQVSATVGVSLKADGGRKNYPDGNGKIPDVKEIRTDFRPLSVNENGTLLEVHLITGRTHQIRAHLAAYGHPLLGDPKYGDPSLNRRLREKYGLRFQLLFACRVVFPELPELGKLSGRELRAPVPEVWQRLFPGVMELTAGAGRKEP